MRHKKLKKFYDPLYFANVKLEFGIENEKDTNIRTVKNRSKKTS